jgi:hypothetical protein
MKHIGRLLNNGRAKEAKEAKHKLIRNRKIFKLCPITFVEIPPHELNADYNLAFQPLSYCFFSKAQLTILTKNIKESMRRVIKLLKKRENTHGIISDSKFRV